MSAAVLLSSPPRPRALALVVLVGPVARRRRARQPGLTPLRRWRRRCRRPVLPARRQWRHRRAALRPRPRLHARTARAGTHPGTPRRRRHDRPRRDAGPRPLQPRPARTHRITGDGRRQVDEVRTDRERTRHHSPSEAQSRRAGAGRRHVRGHDDPADRHRGSAVRLGDHSRRRDGRQRTRRLGHLVPGQRPSDRQVDVHLRDHRARGPRRPSRTDCRPANRPRPAGALRGTGTPPTRWRPTSRPRASATT